MKRPKEEPVRLFVSYSHENPVWFKRLSPVLKFRPTVSLAYTWHDQELKAGDRWDKAIREELEKMDVFVCLLSYNFQASDYIMDVEVKRALEREKNGEIEIVPIILYPMNLRVEIPSLHEFCPLPAWGKCWRDYERNGGEYQDAHQPIREGLRQAIDKVKSKRV